MSAAAPTLAGGFGAPSIDAARAFRAILDAMSRPGREVKLSGVTPPPPLSPAAGAAILTLADHATPVHLAGGHDADAVRAWITFQTGAPLVGRERAAFAIGPWDALTPLDDYPLGTPDYPDRSAMLIVDGGPSVLARLSGPGIDRVTKAHVPDVEALVRNASGFPLGLDVIVCRGERLLAIPRSTTVEAA